MLANDLATTIFLALCLGTRGWHAVDLTPGVKIVGVFEGIVVFTAVIARIAS